MSKLTYWERRQVQDQYQHFQKAEDVADQIAKLYLKASRYLSLQSDEIFERYQAKHGLSEAEALRLINTMQDRTSLDELLQKLKSSESSKEKQELITQLEAPAYQARLERLRQTQNQLDLLMQNIYQQEKDFSTSFYTDLANESYYRSIFNIQQRVGLAFGFNHVSADTINQVVGSRWSGKNYSERIWGNTKSLAQDLKEELLINLVTGRTNREASEIIAHKFAGGASKARRLVWTESAYVSGELNFKAYQECDIEKYRYLATLDLRTSTVCRALDGKVFLISERKVGINYPPMHPWCRSTTISDESEEQLKKWERSAIDPATGKDIKVPANMTYEQWYEKYVKGNSVAEAEQKKIQNRSADKAQHQKYREILGNEIPKSFVKFQELKYNKAKEWEELKAVKQKILNEKDFSEMGNLIGKLGDKEVRQWYKIHDEKIPDLIDRSLPLESQAREAFRMRNENRTAARELMKDQKLRADLDRRYPNTTFEELLKHKTQDKGMAYEQALEDIIKTAAKTNKQVNKSLGLE